MSLLKQLGQIFDATQIRMSAEDLAYYGKDWTTYFDIHASAVVFPKSSKQLEELVRWARAHKQALVPSGGRTGLSGGSCALNGEIVVSFEQMNQILDFNPIDQIVRCQAGVITEQLQKFAVQNNLYYPVDFAARGSSHIGGNIATNAGGIKVVRYGMTRQWVAGLQVVTGQGQTLELNHGLIKNATGPSLMGHFIGSEGIFGFVTEADIQLTAPPPPTQSLLLQVPSLEALMQTYQVFKTQVTLQAFEFFSQAALDKVCSHKGWTPPFAVTSKYYVVLEAESPGPESENQILAAFEKVADSNAVTDGLIAQSSDQARQFWSYREDISECLAPFSPYKNDIAVRISKVPAFLKDTDKVLEQNYPNWEVIWFGHIGDGNLHLNILRPKDLNKEAFVQKCQQVDPLLFKVVQAHQGAISAEHGVGLTKKPFLNFSRSPEELAALKALKTHYDPDNIINPGKVL